MNLTTGFKKSFGIFVLSCLTILLFSSCKKDRYTGNVTYAYYEVGFRSNNADWRDTAFVVRTKNPQLIELAEVQLSIPVSHRKLVVGKLVQGSGGYNKNAAHEFGWHFDETDWQLADVTVEIYDGKPYTDVDNDLPYWLLTIKRFGAWSSYIRKKLPGKP